MVKPKRKIVLNDCVALGSELFVHQKFTAQRFNSVFTKLKRVEDLNVMIAKQNIEILQKLNTLLTKNRHSVTFQRFVRTMEEETENAHGNQELPIPEVRRSSTRLRNKRSSQAVPLENAPVPAEDFIEPIDEIAMTSDCFPVLPSKKVKEEAVQDRVSKNSSVSCFETIYDRSEDFHSALSDEKPILETISLVAPAVSTGKSNKLKANITGSPKLKTKDAEVRKVTASSPSPTLYSPHLGERDPEHWKSFGFYKCDFCPYRTKLKTFLNRHVIKVHANKQNIFKCDECTFCTMNFVVFKSHKKNAHCWRVHAGKFCDYEGKRLANLKKH